MVGMGTGRRPPELTPWQQAVNRTARSGNEEGVGGSDADHQAGGSGRKQWGNSRPGSRDMVIK